MISKELIGMLAGFVGIFGYFPYILQILKGKQKPQRMSWFIWTIVGLLVLLTYDASGAEATTWLLLIYTIGPFILVLEV